MLAKNATACGGANRIFGREIAPRTSRVTDVRQARPNRGRCPNRRRRDVAFRLFDDVGPRGERQLDAPSHGLHARCLRFVAVVANVHAKLASGWWPTFAGRGSNPLGPT